jgi:hypothetical protein
VPLWYHGPCISEMLLVRRQTDKDSCLRATSNSFAQAIQWSRLSVRCSATGHRTPRNGNNPKPTSTTGFWWTLSLTERERVSDPTTACGFRIGLLPIEAPVPVAMLVAWNLGINTFFFPWSCERPHKPSCGVSGERVSAEAGKRKLWTEGLHK